jgi:hypothetical protein
LRLGATKKEALRDEKKRLGVTKKKGSGGQEEGLHKNIFNTAQTGERQTAFGRFCAGRAAAEKNNTIFILS